MGLLFEIFICFESHRILEPVLQSQIDKCVHRSEALECGTILQSKHGIFCRNNMNNRTL